MSVSRDPLAPDFAQPSVAAGDALAILREELPRFCSARPRSNERHIIVYRASQQLLRLSGEWTEGMVRHWFNNNYNDLYASLGPARPAIQVGAAFARAHSVYALAGTHVGFRALMCDKDAALSLVNAVLQEANRGFATVNTLTALDYPLPLGDSGSSLLDFLQATDDGRYVSAEMLALEHVPGPEWIVLCGSHMLSTEDLPLGTSVRKASWVSRLGDIYAIQFLNHDTRNEPFEGSVRVRDRRTVGPLGIHLLEIELPRIKMTFPFSAEQAAGWRAIEWWFYLLKFSDRFQAGEIQKWSGFAIPPGLVSGLKRLVRAEWGRESDYLAELREIEAYQIDLAKRNAAIDAILSASPTRKILRGLLRVLLGIFLSHGSLDRDDVQAVRSPIPEALLKDIWQANRSPNRSADGFEPFLDALRDTGLTII